VLAEIAAAMRDAGLSIESLIQKRKVCRWLRADQQWSPMKGPEQAIH
jgi:hypothetical protein